MQEKFDEPDLLLAWSVRDLFPEEEPPSRIWEVIRARLDTLEVDRSEGGRVMGYSYWLARVGGWLGRGYSWARRALTFPQISKKERSFWSQKWPTPASVGVSDYPSPWPLYSYWEVTLYCLWPLTRVLR